MRTQSTQKMTPSVESTKSSTWSYHIDASLGVSVFKDGILFSGCASSPQQNATLSARRSIAFLMDLGNGLLTQSDSSNMTLKDFKSMVQVILDAINELVQYM